MPKPKPTKYNGQQEYAVRLMARGWESGEIIKELWGIEKKDDPKEFHNKEQTLYRWRHYPCFDEVWKDEINAYISKKLMGKGLRKILAQIDDDEKWISNKAANDAVNFAKGRIFGEEDNRVVVEFADGTGMPEIGTPDTDEADAEE